MAVITIVVTVLAVPDILTMFSFRKISPTYLLTFVHHSSSNFAGSIVPCVMLLLPLFLCHIAVRRLEQIDIASITQ